MSNRMRYGAIATVSIFVVVIFCIIYFSFNSHANSPEYAIKMAEESISQHDKVKFDSVVDVDALLNSSYDSFVEGMVDFDKTMPNEVKDSIANFAQILKVPMTASMKAAIDNYVTTGAFEQQVKDEAEKSAVDENLIAASEILDRSGLSKLEFRQVDKIEVNEDNENQAIAEVRAYQQEAARDFVFEIMLAKNDVGKISATSSTWSIKLAVSSWTNTLMKPLRSFLAMIKQFVRQNKNMVVSYLLAASVKTIHVATSKPL